MFEEIEIEEVEQSIFLSDGREAKEFRLISFSGYKKNDAKKMLFQSINKGNIEPACYWCAELISSGHYLEVWDIFLIVLAKTIHLANPKLAIYLEKRYNIFRNILAKDDYRSELQLRNNPTIRNLFAEITCILAMSPKRLANESVKVKKDEEFDIFNMQDKLKATSTQYAENILKEKDCREIMVPINEFAYHLKKDNNHVPNMANACYWIEWLLTYDQICKKKKQPCYLEARESIPVEYKYQREIVWALWDTLFYEVQNDGFLLKIMNSLLRLYCIKFTLPSAKKRVSLLYFAVSLVTENFYREVVMIKNKDVVEHTLQNLPAIYKQIKKEEIQPSTQYLFMGLHETI